LKVSERTTFDGPTGKEKRGTPSISRPPKRNRGEVQIQKSGTPREEGKDGEKYKSPPLGRGSKRSEKHWKKEEHYPVTLEKKTSRKRKKHNHGTYAEQQGRALHVEARGTLYKKGGQVWKKPKGFIYSWDRA